MIPLFSAGQVREVDLYAINQLGIPSIILMENAALSIYNACIEKFSALNKSVNRLGFICGKGNNGGDGFAAARHFADNGYSVLVVHLGHEDEMTPDALTNFLILRRLSEQNKNIIIKPFGSTKGFLHKSGLEACDVIFDAMIGSGGKSGLREPYNAIISELNEYPAYKAAIDIPTGLNSDTGYAEDVFRADLTITLAEFKKGLFFGSGYECCGEIIKGNIGINNSYFDRFDIDEYLIEPEDAFAFLPHKMKSSHKYSAGKVFTIAGSGKLPGAAVLTSKAALKVGAGSSILAFPRSVRKLAHKNLSEVIVEVYNDGNSEILNENNVKELKKRMEWADTVAIGPGLGREEATQAAVRKIIKDHNFKKIVIDANALFPLSNGAYKDFDLKGAVLTPHLGEFSKLLGIDPAEIKKDLLTYGKKFAGDTGAYLVLKGAPTIVFNPDGESFINTTGNAGMAKFGTGDVLTGVLAGFISQCGNIEEAVILSVYLHSLSADLLLKDYTEYGYTASDIINKMPSAIKFIRKSFV
jgi:NAD(P)H-hydrate epimerase